MLHSVFRTAILVAFLMCDWIVPFHAGAGTATVAEIQTGGFSGISGPGEPVQGDGSGGWRSGKEGVRYKGAHPKAGWQRDWDEKQTTSDRAIDQGLLPPIKPLWELHLRDTIIVVGGDGLYYMTGSSGDNIWDRTDGIELWRSTNLKTWDYLGLVWSLTRDATWQKGAHLSGRPRFIISKRKTPT
jgi:hypothetical protein